MREVRKPCPNCQGAPARPVYSDWSGCCVQCGRDLKVSDQQEEGPSSSLVAEELRHLVEAYDNLIQAGSNLAGLAASEIRQKAELLDQSHAFRAPWEVTRGQEAQAEQEG